METPITNLRTSFLMFACAFFMICGINGSVVFPSAWFYIKNMGGSKSFYGLVLAGQSFGYIMVTPIVAKLYDKTRKGKLILLICIAVKVISNVIYAISLSVYFPLVGFFLNGAANSAYSVLYGSAVRCTPSENRSKLLIFLNTAFSLGSTCGPVFGSLITFHTSVFGLAINDGNSPVIVLTFICGVMLIIMIFQSPEFGTREFPNDTVKLRINGVDKQSKYGDKSSITSYWCFIMFTIFSSSLVTTTLSGITSLLTMELFHLKLLHVKLLFAVGMMSMFLVDLISFVAVSYWGERGLLAFTMIVQLPAPFLLCTYALLWKSVPFIMSYTLIILVCSGLPITTYSFATSLLAKITPLEHAGFIQSMAMADFFLAALLGRALSGRVFSQPLLSIYSFCLLSMSLFDAIWFGYIFKRLPH